MAVILKNRYDLMTVADSLIRIKFGRPGKSRITCRMPMTVNGQNRNQCGGLFLATGSSSISVVDWGVWSKFCMQTELPF